MAPGEWFLYGPHSTGALNERLYVDGRVTKANDMMNAKGDE